MRPAASPPPPPRLQRNQWSRPAPSDGIGVDHAGAPSSSHATSAPFAPSSSPPSYLHQRGTRTAAPPLVPDDSFVDDITHQRLPSTSRMPHHTPSTAVTPLNSAAAGPPPPPQRPPPNRRAAPASNSAQITSSNAMLFHQLQGGMAASRVRLSTGSSSGWGSPRFVPPGPARRLAANGTTAAAAATSGTVIDFDLGVGPSSAAMDVGPADGPHTPEARNGRINGQQAAGGGVGVGVPWGNNGVNADGSFSVVRDEEEANGSGLLDLSPVIVRHAKQRAFNGLGLAFAETSRAATSSRADGMAGVEMRTAGVARPSRATSPPPLTALGGDESVAGSIIEHPSISVDAQPTHSAASPDDARRNDAEEEALLLPVLRHWRADAMEHHLYDTAIFWGDKILSLETSQVMWNDAYLLAKAYFLTHRYSQAEHLLLKPLSAFGRAPDATEAGKLPRGGAHGEGAGRVDDADEELGGSDPLEAALASTRRASVLPPSMARRGGDDEDEAPVAGDESELGKRKERGFTVSGNGTGSERSADGGTERRSRGGSSSSGGGGGGGGGVDGSARGNRGVQAVADVGRNHAAGKRREGRKGVSPIHRENWGGLGKGGEEEGLGEAGEDVEEVEARRKLLDAWRCEQRLALQEVKDRPQPPRDGISLAHASQACRYLAAQCMVRQGKYHDALELLAGWKSEDKYGPTVPSQDGGIKLASSKCFLLGQIHVRLGDFEEGKRCFTRALALDVKNYDAFAALVEGKLLGAEEQWRFVETLNYVAQAGDDPGLARAHGFVRLLYTARLDKCGQEHLHRAAAARRQLMGSFGLEDNADVLLGLAEELFARMRFADAHVVTSRIMELSQDHEAALPLHITCMYHLPHERPSLFLLAHHLTDMDPDLPAAWYAVGCWYASARRWHDARRYFSKAVQLDPRFAAGWIAFAHSFALDGESDQAITSYSTAARHFRQSHLPPLFIGMEHMEQGSLTLAQLFLDASAQIWEQDPLSYNERGLVAYHSNDIPRAIELFEAALRTVDDIQEPPSNWATTHLNLAFAYHRSSSHELLSRDADAERSFLRAMELDPGLSTAYSGLGMTCHRRGDLESAIGWYHEALGVEPRDALTTELLSMALEEAAAEAAAAERPARSGGGPHSEAYESLEAHVREANEYVRRLSAWGEQEQRARIMARSAAASARDAAAAAAADETHEASEADRFLAGDGRAAISTGVRRDAAADGFEHEQGQEEELALSRGEEGEVEFSLSRTAENDDEEYDERDHDGGTGEEGYEDTTGGSSSAEMLTSQTRSSLRLAERSHSIGGGGGGRGGGEEGPAWAQAEEEQSEAMDESSISQA